MDTVTSITLLEGLKDPRNDAAWRRFADRYQTTLISFARRFGLSESDAEDVTQETMLAFAQSYASGQYDRAKGRLRSWLFGIAQHKIANLRAARAKEQRGLGGDDPSRETCATTVATDAARRLWEEEWQKAILAECLSQAQRRFSGRDIEIFNLRSVEGLATEQIATRKGVSREVVYTVTHRILTYMREIAPRVTENW